MRERAGAFLLGCALVLLLLECAVRLTGAWIHKQRDQVPPYLAATGEECRIMCIGESTTALGGTESWPSQLEEILNKASTGRHFRVFNRGIPGINSTAILHELEQNLETTKPSVVVAMMGANDLSQGAQPFIPGSSPPALSVVDLVKSLKLVGFMIDLLEKRFQACPDESVPRIRYEANGFFDVAGYVVSPEVVAAVDGSLPPKRRAAAYVEQGDEHSRRGNFKKSTEFYVQALKTDAHCSLAYVRLAEYFTGLLDLGVVEQLLKQALARDAGSFRAHYEMARFLSARGKSDEARAEFVKAVERSVDVSGMDLLSLAHVYDRLGRVDDAEAALQRLLNLGESALCYDPTLLRYPELQDLIEHHRESTDKIAARIMARPVPFNRVMRYMASYYRRAGNIEQAERAQRSADDLARQMYPPQLATRQNYLLLSQMLSERGIRLIAVQYPGRSFSNLRSIFPAGNEVLFVDNEQCFREAVARQGYRALFWDDIYGDFGHCTEEGNRIIADNVARVILGGAQR